MIDKSSEKWQFSIARLFFCFFKLVVVYNDDAVEKLLDRSQEGEVEKEKEREFGMNEYLRSFKVASYQVKEGVDEVRHFSFIIYYANKHFLYCRLLRG